MIAPSDYAEGTEKTNEIHKEETDGIQATGIRKMQNKQPNKRCVATENIVAALNHAGYFESQSKSIRECCQEAAPQRDVTFSTRSMAITDWKGGDDDGASAHVHEQAVNGEEPTHWLHPQATILEANYNTTEAKADCDDINGVY